MKYHIYIIIVLIVLNSCAESKQNNSPSEKSFTTAQLELDPESKKLNLERNSDSTLTKWIDYYNEQRPSFSLSDFDLNTTDSLRIMQGTVFGSFDNNFDTIYKDFLIFNADKNKYIDFDSYSWFIDETGVPSFSPDQEINLIDIEKKTVSRIAFRGSIEWVEDAFWKNDSTVILLENNYEKQPIITKIDLKNKLVQTFKYRDSLNFKTEYTQLRFKRKGVINE
jgi:hypothetical protein